MNMEILSSFEVTGIKTPQHEFGGAPFVTKRFKFADKTEAVAKLKEADAIVEVDQGDETVDVNGDGVVAIVHVGTIIDTPGEYDDEGNETTAPTFVDGWHVDILTNEPIPVPEIVEGE